MEVEDDIPPYKPSTDDETSLDMYKGRGRKLKARHGYSEHSTHMETTKSVSSPPDAIFLAQAIELMAFPGNPSARKATKTVIKQCYCLVKESIVGRGRNRPLVGLLHVTQT